MTGATQKKTLRQRLCAAADGWPIMLLSAKQEASRLLGEDTEERQVRQLIMRRQKEQRTVSQNQSKKKEHWER